MASRTCSKKFHAMHYALCAMLRAAKNHEKTRQLVHKKSRRRQSDHDFHYRGGSFDGHEDAQRNDAAVCAGYDRRGGGLSRFKPGRDRGRHLHQDRRTD